MTGQEGLRVKDENMTKEQLIAELLKLRKEIIELKLTQKDQDYSSTVSACWSPRQWSSTGNEIFICSLPEQQPAVNHPIKYKFSDLVDVPFIQKLLDSFYMATGIPYGLHDEDNNIISVKGWQDICVQFHRVCPQTECRCKQSDSYIADHLHDGPYVRYMCMNGLIDFASPIIVEGQHLGTIFLGQFLHEPPDENFFRRQAQEYGFDEAAYMEALRQVPIIPEEQIESIMGFYSQLGQILATMGLERKRQLESADQALREREERLRLVLDGTTEGFWDLNIETGEIYRSDRWLDILGYSLEEIESNLHPWKNIIHPEDIHATMTALNDYLDGRIPKYEAEYRVLTKSSEIKWIFERGSVVLSDDKGKPLRIAGTSTDITKRKQMEDELRLSEECLSKAFNACPVLMSISTLEEGIFIKANHAFYRITGYSNQEVIGQSSLEFGFWANPADRYVVKQRLMANQPVQDTEIDFCKYTGEQRLGLYSAERLDVNGESCIFSVLTDITDIRQIEVEMTRLDRLNVVGEMAASIGHEIRNPMTTVRGYLQLLQQNKDYHQEIEYFDLMIEELDSANLIITEFLSLAKNKMVEMKLRNLNAIINKSLLLIQANAMSRDKQIKLELHDLPELLLDEKEIRQLILNLVNNGMEAMSSTGYVTIRTVVEEEDVVLAVQDQGHGIDRELLDKLGTPFFTTKEQGTGLGLAVCYRIAARHNAKIDLETGSAGTTFYVRFPIPTAAAII